MADSQPPPSQPTNGSQEQPAPSSSTAPVSSDATVKPEPDLDASIEQDIDMNADSAAGPNPDEGEAALDPIAAALPPSKKETSLREFLSKMDDYAPIVSPKSFFRPFFQTLHHVSFHLGYSYFHRNNEYHSLPSLGQVQIKPKAM